MSNQASICLSGNSSTLQTTVQSSEMDYMTSLQIAEITGKRHDAVLRDIRNLLSQGVTAHNFVVSDYKDTTGRTLPCYNLTKKGCLILASGYSAKLREAIINRWEQLESEKRTGGFQVPQSFSEALMLAASQQRQIEEHQKHIARLQPKADFADMAFATDDKVDIGMSAKILKLGFGRNTLFKKLKEKGVLFGSRNEPKQKFIDAGYFELTEKFIDRADHPGFVVTKVLVTQKGLAYINRLFNGNPSDGKVVAVK